MCGVFFLFKNILIRCSWVLITHPSAPLRCMSLDIKDYSSQLEQLCAVCKSVNRCKDKSRICAFKKLAFLMAKCKLARDSKKGLIERGSD